MDYAKKIEIINKIRLSLFEAEEDIFKEIFEHDNIDKEIQTIAFMEFQPGAAKSFLTYEKPTNDEFQFTLGGLPRSLEKTR